MDALDAVKGTATSLPGKTGLGAKAALAGLAAVNQQGWHWRAAVAGALSCTTRRFVAVRR